jgi:hypothetical protein
MTPVEATATLAGSTPIACAAAACIARAACIPAGPVAALALPEFAITARRAPGAVSSRQTRTGAASTPERV